MIPRTLSWLDFSFYFRTWGCHDDVPPLRRGAVEDVVAEDVGQARAHRGPEWKEIFKTLRFRKKCKWKKIKFFLNKWEKRIRGFWEKCLKGITYWFKYFYFSSCGKCYFFYPEINCHTRWRIAAGAGAVLQVPLLPLRVRSRRVPPRAARGPLAAPGAAPERPGGRCGRRTRRTRRWSCGGTASGAWGGKKMKKNCCE